MEKSTRSLRRLPARSAKSAERISSKLKTTQETDSPKRTANSPRLARRTLKDIEPKESIIKKASPPRRRSRSRSNARKKQETVKEVKEVFDKDVFVEKFNSRITKTSGSVPATKIVSRLKESVELIRNSVSPEVEEVVRRSLSRFEEVTSEVVSTVMMRRASSRLSRSSPSSVIGNNVPTDDTLEEEKEQRVLVTNHTGVVKNEKSPTRQTKNKLDYFKLVVLVMFGIVISASVVMSHVICSKEDCRLLVANLPKALNYAQYFDSYAWPVYSLSLLFLIVGFRFASHRLRRPQHFSIIGGIAAVMVILGMWSGHYYPGILNQLRILQLVGATIVHTLVLISYAGSSVTIARNVPLETFIQASSSIMMVVLNASIIATESSRTSMNMGVLLVSGLQVFISFDNLLLPPMALGLGPLGLLWFSLRPFILVLPQTYLSANNVVLDIYALVAVTIAHIIGYILYRYSSTLKTTFLRDPYSPAFSKTSLCGDLTIGPYSWIRHPHLLGLLVCELSWAFSAFPSLLSTILIIISLASNTLVAASADRLLSRTYRLNVRSSLLPFLPY